MSIFFSTSVERTKSVGQFNFPRVFHFHGEENQIHCVCVYLVRCKREEEEKYEAEKRQTKRLHRNINSNNKCTKASNGNSVASREKNAYNKSSHRPRVECVFVFRKVFRHQVSEWPSEHERRAIEWALGVCVCVRFWMCLCANWKHSLVHFKWKLFIKFI